MKRNSISAKGKANIRVGLKNMFKFKNPFSSKQELEADQARYCRTCKWVTDWDICNADGEYSKCTNQKVNEDRKPVQSIEERCIGKKPKRPISPTDHLVFCSIARKNYGKCKEQGIYWLAKDGIDPNESSITHEERLIREQIKKLEYRLGTIKKETLK